MGAATFTQNLVNVQGELLHFAYKLTSDHEEANDLLQETSLKALHNEDKYTAETNFKGWIYTIMLTGKRYVTRHMLTRRIAFII